MNEISSFSTYSPVTGGDVFLEGGAGFVLFCFQYSHGVEITHNFNF